MISDQRSDFLEDVTWHGKTVRTSIWKSPVEGRVRLSKLNLDGDQQSDLSVHGGVDKAIDAYPYEHYSFWRSQLPDPDLAWGAFGENFTTEGLLKIRCISEIVSRRSGPTIVRSRMPSLSAGYALIALTW